MQAAPLRTAKPIDHRRQVVVVNVCIEIKVAVHHVKVPLSWVRDEVVSLRPERRRQVREIEPIDVSIPYGIARQRVR